MQIDLRCILPQLFFVSQVGRKIGVVVAAIGGVVQYGGVVLLTQLSAPLLCFLVPATLGGFAGGYSLFVMAVFTSFVPLDSFTHASPSFLILTCSTNFKFYAIIVLI